MTADSFLDPLYGRGELCPLASCLNYDTSITRFIWMVRFVFRLNNNYFHKHPNDLCNGNAVCFR
jgi:hypothetical protein